MTILNEVWVLYIYEVTTAMLRSIHATKESAEEAMAAQEEDGFVMNYNLYD